MNAHMRVSRLLHYSTQALTLNNSFPPLRLTVNPLSSSILSACRGSFEDTPTGLSRKSFKKYLRKTFLLALRLLESCTPSPVVKAQARLTRETLFFTNTLFAFPLPSWF